MFHDDRVKAALARVDAKAAAEQARAEALAADPVARRANRLGATMRQKQAAYVALSKLDNEQDRGRAERALLNLFKKFPDATMPMAVKTAREGAEAVRSWIRENGL